MPFKIRRRHRTAKIEALNIIRLHRPEEGVFLRGFHPFQTYADSHVMAQLDDKADKRRIEGAGENSFDKGPVDLDHIRRGQLENAQG